MPIIPSSFNEKSSDGPHPARKSRQNPAGRYNDLQFPHLLQTQISCLYECFDRDEDVLCLAQASKATNQSIRLLRDTPGAVYFGREGAFGLCRHQSLKMVATSCRLRNKIEFVDKCQADTPLCVEFCVTNVQRASFFAGAPRKYFLATIDTFGRLDARYRLIDSLRLRICLVYDRSGIMTFFEDIYGMYGDEDPVLNQYQGVAFPVACSCEPLFIPSDSPIEAQHLEAIISRPTFLIAIWKSDGTAVTPLPRYRERLL